jgi:Tol biopolymer transport system component
MGKSTIAIIAVVFYSLSVCSTSVALTRLTSDPANDTDPEYSPDGSKIVFCSNRLNFAAKDLWIMNADGSGQHPLLTDPGDEKEPTWSPDGEWIAYCSDRDVSWDIWKIRSSGGTPVKITMHPEEDSYPTWSPDGQTIYFSSLRTGNREIFSIPANGGPVTQLTDHPEWDEYPDCSPSGDYLVWWSNRYSMRDVLIMSVHDLTPEVLVGEPEMEDFPNWSYDGKYVVYVLMESPGGQNADLMIIDVQTKNITRITDDPEQDWWPSFHPSGTKIIFGSHRNGNTDIYTVDVAPILEQSSLGRIKAAYK